MSIIQSPRVKSGLGADISARPGLIYIVGFETAVLRVSNCAQSWHSRGHSIIPVDERRSRLKKATIRNLLGPRSIMETFYIVIAIAAMSGFCVWLFVIEPRRKIPDL